MTLPRGARGVGRGSGALPVRPALGSESRAARHRRLPVAAARPLRSPQSGGPRTVPGADVRAERRWWARRWWSWGIPFRWWPWLATQLGAATPRRGDTFFNSNVIGALASMGDPSIRLRCRPDGPFAHISFSAAYGPNGLLQLRRHTELLASAARDQPPKHAAGPWHSQHPATARSSGRAAALVWQCLAAVAGEGRRPGRGLPARRPVRPPSEFEKVTAGDSERQGIGTG